MPDTPARWLLVRHGPTVWAPEPGTSAAPAAGGTRYAGWSDVPLSAAGREQAAALGRRLAPLGLGTCYSSDLGRSRQTIELVLEQHQHRPRPAVHFDPDLRELHFGAWEGLTYACIAAAPDGPAVLSGERAAPGGESLAGLAARVARFLDRLRQQPAPDGPGTTLVVGHGGSLRVMLCLLLDLPAAAHWRFRLDHSSLTEVDWSAASGPQLVRLNDTGHIGHTGHVSHTAPGGTGP